VVLRATDHKLPQQKPLEAVHTELIAAWKKQRGAELAAAAAADAVEHLMAGESWEAVAKKLSVPTLPPKFVARANQDVPLPIRTTAFAQPKPGAKPVYADTQLDNGDAAVIALTALREEPGDPKLEGVGLRRQFAAQIASTEAQSYAAGARADAKVILNPQAIE
jgi:peptidyl-prolyl cis-trans isomerase D